MFELLHCVLHCVLHAILQLKALCDTRPLRSLVPARFICLSTMLKRKCREGLDTVTRKKPFRREARAFRFSSIADKAGTWHGHTETIRNQARSGVKDSKHIEKRWNTHTHIYIYFLFSFLEDKSDTLQIRTCRLMLCPSESFFSLDEATCRFSVWQRSSRATSILYWTSLHAQKDSAKMSPHWPHFPDFESLPGACEPNSKTPRRIHFYLSIEHLTYFIHSCYYPFLSTVYHSKS